MVLHLGHKKYVYSGDIIAILDLNDKGIRDCLADSQAQDSSWHACIVCTEEVLFCEISASTLAQRGYTLSEGGYPNNWLCKDSG